MLLFLVALYKMIAHDIIITQAISHSCDSMLHSKLTL